MRVANATRLFFFNRPEHRSYAATQPADIYRRKVFDYAVGHCRRDTVLAPLDSVEGFGTPQSYALCELVCRTTAAESYYSRNPLPVVLFGRKRVIKVVVHKKDADKFIYSHQRYWTTRTRNIRKCPRKRVSINFASGSKSVQFPDVRES